MVQAKGGDDMNAQKWLTQVREADEEIQILRRSMFDAWALATSTTPTLDGIAVQTSHDPHRFDGIAELDEAIYDRIRELSAMKAKAVRVISTLPDPRQRKALIAYYVDCRDDRGRKKTWEMVAVELAYSFSQLMEIRSRALRALDEKTG